MLSQLFIHMLNIGYQVAIIVLVVWVTRGILSKMHFPKRYLCYLWLIPLVRLILPVTIPFSFSLMPPHSNPVPENIAYMKNPVIYTQSETINEVAGRTLSKAFPVVGAETEGRPMQMGLSVLSMVWVIGILIMVLYAVGSYVRLKKKLRYAAGTGEKGVYVADYISTAFVMGLKNPRVYLPSGLSDDVTSYVLAHEKMHISRRDHFLKLVAYMVTAVYWCNPFVWITYIMLTRDIELACDEAVICEKSVAYRREYAKALLLMAVDMHGKMLSPLAFSEGSPKKRIRMIAGYKRPAIVVSIVGGIACILLGCGLLTSKPEMAAGKETISIGEDEGKKDTGKDADGEIVNVAKPEIDLAASAGEDEPELLYADQDRIVFAGDFGLFVYSKTNDRIIRAVDLAAIGLDPTKRDNTCEKIMLEDGDTIYLIPATKDFYYVYTIGNNQLIRYARKPDEYPEDGFGDAGFHFPSGNLSGDSYDEWKQAEVAMNTVVTGYHSGKNSGRIGGLTWRDQVQEPESSPKFDSLSCENWRYLFPPEGYENAKWLTIEDIRSTGIEKLEMRVNGKMVAVSDGETLELFEKGFDQAEEITGSGCPFDEPMYITLKDGTVGWVNPGTDSCGVLVTADGYYQARDYDLRDQLVNRLGDAFGWYK